MRSRVVVALSLVAPVALSKQVVGGFWKGGPGPVTVSVGSAQAGDDPSILAVFPNNAPATQHRVIGTST